MIVDFEQQDIIIEFTPEGKDGKSIRPLGEWSDTATYQALDLVAYQGDSYIALKDVPAGTLPTDTEYWMLNASNQTTYWGTIDGTLSSQTDLQTALDAKADADTVYTKTETDTLLAGKADADTVYTKTETDDLLDLKANLADVYTQTELDGIFDGIDNALSTKADKTDVYTKTEADALLADKADADDVYTKTETDDLLSAKANTADLGSLADQDTVDYQTEVTNKPTLGALSALDSISYESNYLTDKPVLGDLASKDTVDYETEVTNKPTLGTMASQDDAPSDDAQYVRKNGAWEDLAPTLNDKADIIKSTASGSIAHITDAAAMPVDSLTVGIEPVQDLHGYDNPWPAGGGANKLSPSASGTITNNDITFVSDGNGKYTLSGTASANANATFVLDTPYTIQSGDYLHIGNSVAVGTFVLTFSDESTGSPSMSSVNRIFTPTNYIGKTLTKIGFSIPSGSAFNGTIQPMILSTSSATSWSPYSNVCPISGHATATVTRTGKNLCEGSTNDLISINSTEASVISGTGTCLICHLVKGQTYTFSNTDLNRRVVSYWDSLPSVGSTTPYFQNLANYTFTAIKSGLALIYIYNAAVDASNAQIELGSDTAYAPYQGQTVTIDLDGTRYGGMVDALTGVMTVDRKYIADLSTLSWEKQNTTSPNWRFRASLTDAPKTESASTTLPENLICSIYKAITPSASWTGSDTGITIGNTDGRLMVCDMTYSDKTTFTSAMNGVQLAYTLATPITVQLTPAELSLLFGTNNVWADTGDTSVGYRADTKLYIERLTKPTEDDMTANVNIASGKYFMVGNSLFLASQSIASGETIVPGTNCTALSLADALNNLS